MEQGLLQLQDGSPPTSGLSPVVTCHSGAPPSCLPYELSNLFSLLLSLIPSDPPFTGP